MFCVPYIKLEIALLIVFSICTYAPLDLAEDNRSKYSQEHNIICNDGDELEMNACIAKKYEQADSEMNRVYIKLIGQLISPEGVRNAQRAWIKYRNAECSNDIFQLSEPNTISAFVKTACKRTLTLERTQLLKDKLHQDCNGCPPKK